jgi:hypothetical protein
MGKCAAFRIFSVLSGLLLSAATLHGCATPEQGLTATAVTATLLGGQAPSNELEQIYYIGVFDPQEQLPPEVYRIRVRGQSSAYSFKKFGSGWVPAAVIDGLGTHVHFSEESGQVVVDKGEEALKGFETGRRLMLFGPHGFRPAPKDHRLVLVMGSDPSAFFNAIDTALGTVSKVRDEQRQATLTTELFRALTTVQKERARLEDLDAVLKSDQSGGNV